MLRLEVETPEQALSRHTQEENGLLSEFDQYTAQLPPDFEEREPGSLDAETKQTMDLACSSYARYLEIHIAPTIPIRRILHILGDRITVGLPSGSIPNQDYKENTDIPWDGEGNEADYIWGHHP